MLTRLTTTSFWCVKIRECCAKVSRNAVLRKGGLARLNCRQQQICDFSTSHFLNDSSKISLTISKLMGPDDANVKGNVHGGNILNMIEQAGAVVATRYCNEVPQRAGPNFEASVATLARIEKMDFNSPVYLGDVAEVHAHVAFTSARSLLVVAKVYGENVITGKRRFTNEAHLWYVPTSLDNPDRVLAAPALPMTDTQRESGLQEYRKRALQRSCTILHIDEQDNELHTVGHSRTILTKLVNPSDLAHHGFCKGGVVLKLMDECAAIAAGKHCKGPAVTASMDAMNFLHKSKQGALLTFYGYVTHTSKKSLEVQVLVDGESPFSVDWRRYRAAESNFVFVTLDSDGKIADVPALKIKNKLEERRYEAAHKRYLERTSVRKRQISKNSS